MVAEQEDVFYYLTLMNENYPHPALPEGSEADILKGMYKFRDGAKAKKGGLRVQLLGSGTSFREVIAAADLLKNDWGVDADLWSCPSFVELARGCRDATRWNLLHPTEQPRRSHVEACLADTEGPVIAATDYMSMFADKIRTCVPRRYHVLGTDGFGRSDTREQLRSFFEVDRRWVTDAALKALADDGALAAARVPEAIAKYGLDPAKPAPWTVCPARGVPRETSAAAEDRYPARQPLALPGRDEARPGLWPAAEDDHPAAWLDERAQLGERQGQRPQRDGAGGGPRVAVVAPPQHLDAAAAGRAGGLAQEGPASGARLEQRHLQVVAQQRQDEPGGAVAGANVDQRARLRQPLGGYHVAHQQPHALGGATGAGQVDPAAPGRERVEIGGETPEIEVQKAKAGLAAEAAALAVDLAEGKIKSSIGKQDHERIVKEYISKVGGRG